MSMLALQGCLALLLALASPQVEAAKPFIGACITLEDNSQKMSDAVIGSISYHGEYALVVDDPLTREVTHTCMRVILNYANPEGTYRLRYKNAQNQWREESGVLKLIQSGIAHRSYQTDGSSTLGGGTLYVEHYNYESFILKSCLNTGLLAAEVATYVLTPLWKAQKYSTCNCNNWNEDYVPHSRSFEALASITSELTQLA